MRRKRLIFSLAKSNKPYRNLLFFIIPLLTTSCNTNESVNEMKEEKQPYSHKEENDKIQLIQHFNLNDYFETDKFTQKGISFIEYVCRYMTHTYLESIYSTKNCSAIAKSEVTASCSSAFERIFRYVCTLPRKPLLERNNGKLLHGEYIESTIGANIFYIYMLMISNGAFLYEVNWNIEKHPQDKYRPSNEFVPEYMHLLTDDIFVLSSELIKNIDTWEQTTNVARGFSKESKFDLVANLPWVILNTSKFFAKIALECRLKGNHPNYLDLLQKKNLIHFATMICEESEKKFGFFCDSVAIV